MLAMLIFPPWTKITHHVVLASDRNRSTMQTETQEFAGYSPLLEPPKTRSLPAYQTMLVPGDYYESVQIDFGLFLLQWLTAAFLTAAGLLYFKGSDKKSLQEWWSSVITHAKPVPLSNPPKATPPDPPISKTQVPADAGSNKASESTPPSRMSPWKRADKAFGFGFFVGVANTYFVHLDISSSDRMLMAGIFGIVIGLLAYLVAVVYYAGKGKREVAAQTDATKARNRSGLVLVGIIGLFAILWLIGKNQETKTAQENPNSSVASQVVSSGQVDKPNNAADAETQAAAQFEKDFYEKYTDLKPYGPVLNAVASRLQASGYRGESREAIMEMFANAAREELGRHFEQGNGVTKDYVEAAKWYQKAAEQNYAPAQYNLGVCYANGQGVAKNDVESVKWYRKAAEQNHAGAQCDLGVCYAFGDGVAKDYVEAVKWYRKAAEQNFAKAQYKLAGCYAIGNGVPIDYVEAYKWLNVASAQGLDSAKEYLSIIEQEMTPEQIAEAQRLVREFKPTEAAESGASGSQ